MNKRGILSIPVRQLLRQLETSRDGLSGAEAAKRLRRKGPNEVVERPGGAARWVIDCFWGPLPWAIELAAVLSALSGQLAELAVIAALLAANAAAVLWERRRASLSFRFLDSKVSVRASARRDAKWRSVPSREVVPGDVVRLRIGDVVPADARLLEGDPLSLEQAALTGESSPVDAASGSTVHAGAVVWQGETEAVVFATGGDCRFGRPAMLVDDSETTGRLQRAAVRAGDAMAATALLVVIVVLAVALFRGEPMLPVARLALVLCVVVIPITLPRILSATMAAGVRRLAGLGAVLTRPGAVDDLANIDVLWADKQGTLTEDRASLGEPLALGGATPAQVLEAAALACDESALDPVDTALLQRSGAVREGREIRVLRVLPFDRERRRLEATVAAPDGSAAFRVSRGAPNAVLALADNGPELQPEAERAVRRFATGGYRTLGVARTDESGRWRFLGVLPVIEPPREEAREAVAAARSMGVQVRMVCGDPSPIAGEIARRLGMGDRILDAAAVLADQGREGSAVEEAVERADGIARALPEHKTRIVDILRRRGHTVAVTGETVTDAPAMKRADIGIAVAGASDAARLASRVVLTSPGLSPIVAAVREARAVVRRIEGYTLYRVAETVRILLFVALAILCLDFYPVSAAALALLALLNEAAMLAAARDRAPAARRPAKGDLNVILGVAAALGLAGVVSTLALVYIAGHLYHMRPDTIRTLVYLELSVAGQLTIFAARTEGPLWGSRPSAALAAAVLAAQAAATLIAVYGVLMAPLGWRWAAAVWAYAAAWLLLRDLLKQAVYRALRRGLLGPRTHDEVRLWNGTGDLAPGGRP